MWRPGQKIEALMIQFAPSAPRGPRPTDLAFGYGIFAIQLSNERRHLRVTYVTSKETRRLPHDRSDGGRQIPMLEGPLASMHFSRLSFL